MPSGRLSGKAPFLMAPECRSSSSLQEHKFPCVRRHWRPYVPYKMSAMSEHRLYRHLPYFPVLFGVQIINFRFE